MMHELYLLLFLLDCAENAWILILEVHFLGMQRTSIVIDVAMLEMLREQIQ